MDIPQCYGEFWEGIQGSACMECHIKDDCLAKFATGRLVKAQQKVGVNASLEALSKETGGIATEAIQLALQFQKNVGLKKSEAPAPPAPPAQPAQPTMPPPQEQASVTAPPPPPPMPQSGTEPQEPEKAPEAGDEMAKKKTTKKSAAKKPAKKTITKKKTTKAAAKPKPKAKPKSKAKPKTTAKTKPKAAPKKKGATSRPPKAGVSAKPAKAPAKSKKGSATSASAQAGDRTWSPEHDQVRFNRERKRSPVLAQLKPGQTLKREWPPKSGETVEVRVLKGRYKFQDQEFPTLYSAVKEIVGTIQCPKQLREDGTRPQGKRKLVNWSAAKFFKASLEKMGAFEAAKKAKKKKAKPKKK